MGLASLSSYRKKEKLLGEEGVKERENKGHPYFGLEGFIRTTYCLPGAGLTRLIACLGLG